MRITVGLFSGKEFTNSVSPEDFEDTDITYVRAVEMFLAMAKNLTYTGKSENVVSLTEFKLEFPDALTFIRSDRVEWMTITDVVDLDVNVMRIPDIDEFM